MDTDSWRGWDKGGGVIMVVLGLFRTISGIIGLFNSQWTVRGFTGYYVTSSTGLAWWTLVIGLLVLIGGVGVLAGRNWGRWMGIVFTGLALVSELFWIPIYPFWSMLMIPLFLGVLYALVIMKPGTED